MRKKIKKFQEGGRVRAGNLAGTPASRAASRERTSALEARVRREEEDAAEISRAERASGGRYQDPPRPRGARAGDAVSYSDADAGNPRGVSLLDGFTVRNGMRPPPGEDTRPGGDNSIGTARARAYGRADRAAMQADTDREVRSRLRNERAYKKGGLVKKGKSRA